MLSLPPLLLVGVGVLCLGQLLHFIGLGTPNWIELSTPRGSRHAGLFKSCLDSKCDSIDNPSGKLMAVQAMAIIGLLCGLLGVVSAIVFVVFKVAGKPVNKMSLLLSMAACAAAGLFIIVGVGVYAGEIYKPDHDDSSDVKLGFSFALCIVGAVLLGAGGALSFVGGRSAAD